MTRVLEFLLGHAAGLSRLVGRVAFEGLQRGRLVHAHRVRPVGGGPVRSCERRVADHGRFLLELLRVLLRRVEPHLRTVRLDRSRLQVPADLRDGDARHDLPLEHLVAQLTVSPAVDRSVRKLRRLARQGHDLRNLLGGGPRGYPPGDPGRGASDSTSRIPSRSRCGSWHSHKHNDSQASRHRCRQTPTCCRFSPASIAICLVNNP